MFLKKCISEEEIKSKIFEVSKSINYEYPKEDLIVIGVLKGSFMFLSDLVRNIKFSIPVIDFIRVSSYSGTYSTNCITITKDIESNIEGKNVLIVEDILDTGLTLNFLIDHLKSKNPKSLKTCVFLDKKEKRKIQIEADFVCFEIGDKFVVGYGLDYNEKYRNLKEVYTLEN